MTAASIVCGIAWVGSLLVAISTGRPWDLQSTPTLHAVNVKGVELQLPSLVSSPIPHPNGQTFTFGALSVDPVAFVFTLSDAILTDEEAQDSEGQFQSAVESFKPGIYPDFSETTATELRHKDGRPYLFHRQSSKDGRTCDAYLLMEAKHIFSVLVMSAANASEPWRATAETVPFLVRFP